MVVLKTHQIYPCGYEVKVTIRTLIGMPYFRDDNACPIHGKECKRKETKK